MLQPTLMRSLANPAQKTFRPHKKSLPQWGLQLRVTVGRDLK